MAVRVQGEETLVFPCPAANGLINFEHPTAMADS